MEYDLWLKRKGLQYENNFLYFVGVKCEDITRKFGTPLYVMSEDIIRNRYRELKETLNEKYQRNQIHFAVKSNSSLSMLKILQSEGAFFDCTSTGEIHTCLKIGIAPDHIIYTGNMFTNQDFDFAVKNDVTINLDSLSQLKRLNEVHQNLKKEKKVISFRINPEFGAGHHVHTITAGKEIKFGILEDQVFEAYSTAKEMGFQKFGIHQHIGSGIINPMDYKKAVENFLRIIDNIITKLHIKFKFVDFGGGLGIPYRPSEDPLNLNTYCEIVLDPFIEYYENKALEKPFLKIEPGRYISAESSIILTEVNTVKDNGFKLFAGVDAGFNTLIRPAFYGSYHHIIACKQKNERLTYDIAGPICESGDILGKEREISKIAEGDILAILDAGAYGYIMSSPYNSRPRPAEILINNGKSLLIRKAESFDDLMRLQNIPDHLK
ncbi:MAG: diaminopimelate decarboxylase [Promethearchaeota archaeon]|nr:MAG: diaminopimelate decarboxylase [Candidatus Lokiarchaeota archaeon]